jgi:Transposase DDE domain
VLRDVRYPIGRPGFRTRPITLVTTLLDAALSRVADLAERYRQRWQVETALAPLKTTMRLDVVPGKTVPGVLKALTGLALVDNWVRMVMRDSAIRQHLAVERISFLDALRWLSAPRPYRVAPRVKKRRPKSFPFMMKPRQDLRQQVVQQTLGG